MATKQNKTTRRSTAGSGQAQRLGIFGASGCGKTTKARELTAGLGRVIYFDPLGEWGRDKGVKPFVSLDKLKQALRRNFGQGFRFAFFACIWGRRNAVAGLELLSGNAAIRLWNAAHSAADTCC